MGQARPWCCLLKFNQSRGLTRCQQVLGPLAGNECLLPRSSQEYSMSPDLYSETKWRFTTEQGQQGVYNSASEMVVAVTTPPFISVRLMDQWVSGDCPILPLAFQEILTPSADSTELHWTQWGCQGRLWCLWVAAVPSLAGPASISAPVPEDLLGTMGVCFPGCAPWGVTPGATASFTVLVTGSQGVSKETEPRCPQRETAHQFARGCLFSLPCLTLPHSSLVLPEIISPWINDLLPILYLNICFWRNIKWDQAL